jgi:hypothetical protein
MDKEMGGKFLMVLHDHYKETFALVRDREKQRDKLFIYIICVVGAMFLSTQYPGFLPSAVEVGSVGASFSLSIPAAVATSVLWTVMLTLSLRYCNYTVLIDRQYPYIALLEEKISLIIGDEDVYRREGKVYNDKYPVVSWWTWFIYTLVFPALVIASVVVLGWMQWRFTAGAKAYRSYDIIVGSAVVITFMLYKIWPVLQNIFKRGKDDMIEHGEWLNKPDDMRRLGIEVGRRNRLLGGDKTIRASHHRSLIEAIAEVFYEGNISAMSLQAFEDGLNEGWGD